MVTAVDKADIDRQVEQTLERLMGSKLIPLTNRLTELEKLRGKGGAATIRKSVDGHHHMESVELFDEGVSQGYGYQLDFQGVGVSSVRSGRKHIVTVPGGGAGGAIILQEDNLDVNLATSTLDFTELDGVLLSTLGGEVDVNMMLYAKLAGRAGGQTLIGTTTTGGL